MVRFLRKRRSPFAGRYRRKPRRVMRKRRTYVPKRPRRRTFRRNKPKIETITVRGMPQATQLDKGGLWMGNVTGYMNATDYWPKLKTREQYGFMYDQFRLKSVKMNVWVTHNDVNRRDDYVLPVLLKAYDPDNHGRSLANESDMRCLPHHRMIRMHPGKSIGLKIYPRWMTPKFDMSTDHPFAAANKASAGDWFDMQNLEHNNNSSANGQLFLVKGTPDTKLGLSFTTTWQFKGLRNNSQYVAPIHA